MKYRIYIMDSDPDGQQYFWVEDFDTMEAAQTRIKTVNNETTSSLIFPDCIMKAEDRVEIINDN
jgi:hypothetical protein